MDGRGPFLWLVRDGPRAGFRELPEGGMCLSVFLFARRGRETLLGRYDADAAEWETLTGLDEGRRRAYATGWTVPATHLRFGEHPRDAARRLWRDVLRLPGEPRLEGPRVETDVYAAPRRPEHEHFDIWFIFGADVPEGTPAPRVPWYAALEWKDLAALEPDEYARGHEDVVRRS